MPAGTLALPGVEPPLPSRRARLVQRIELLARESGLLPGRLVEGPLRRHLEMRAEKPTLVQVDGDLLGELPMKAHVVPDALKVFY